MNRYDTGIFPPDTMGAIGPNHFVEVLNNRIAVFDRSNPANNASEDARTFFGLPVSFNHNVFDPRVLYDASAGRWVISALYPEGRRILLARSQDSSPSLTGNWRKEVIDVVWDISLMTVNNVSELPQSGTSLVVIARCGTQGTLQFRIFGFDGTLALDAPEGSYSAKAAEIAALKAYLQDKWTRELAIPLEVAVVVNYLESITGYAIDDRALARPDFDTLGMDNHGIYISVTYQADRGHGIVAIPKAQL